MVLLSLEPSLRQAAGRHALAVAVQSDEFAWIIDVSQGVLAGHRLWWW